MLPKKYRLTFLQFHQNKQKSIVTNTPLISVYIKKSTFPATRFVVVVPKAVDKRSTKRHAIRRIVYQSIFDKLKSLRPSFDVLIKVKSLVDKPTLYAAIQKLLIQNNLILAAV